MINRLNLFLAVIFSFIVPIEACTGIKLLPKDGSIIHGRTLEFGVVIDTSVVVVPREFEFTGTTPNGPGIKYKTKYGAVGVMAFDKPAMMDGLNERGLAVGTFYFPGFAEYTPVTAENQSMALSSVEFPNWILTQYETIDEVKENLSKVIIVPTIVQQWGPTPAPFHYIVFDKTGKCLVIEPISGKLQVTDNPLGIFTNSPYFDWHMVNLRNYINLTAINAKPLQVAGLTFSPFGQGSGMVGMPGDFTPPSRFVRAAIFSITATPSATADEAIGQAFHILNQFDIPIGAARSIENGVVYSDYTQFTCVRDPQALKYYFKTYDDQSIRMVDLKSFNLDDKAIKKLNTTKGYQAIIDVSNELK